MIKRNRPDAHASACLVHPSGVEYVRAHGSSNKDSKDTFLKTLLYYLQTQIRSGFRNRLTTQVLEIGDTLANLVRTMADKVMEQRDTARLGQLHDCSSPAGSLGTRGDVSSSVYDQTCAL